MRNCLLVLVVACSRTPTTLVVQMGQSEKRVSLSLLQRADVPLEQGCNAYFIPDQPNDARVTCPDSGYFLECGKDTKEKPRSMSTGGMRFSAWCE